LISGNLNVSLEDPKYLWESTTTNNHGNLDTNLIIIFIFMLLCPNELYTGDLYNLWLWRGNFNTPLIGVTQIIVFTLTWLNSYCPYASLRGNCTPVLISCLLFLSSFHVPDFQLAVT